jgi:four helix bundle protein
VKGKDKSQSDSARIGYKQSKKERGGLGSQAKIEGVGDFKKLDAWRKSQKLVACIYRLTDGFPSAERYGLSSQMRRAAISVSANLAEGCGRQGDVELRRFVRISLGSLSELECELLLAADLQFVEPRTCPNHLYGGSFYTPHATALTSSSPLQPSCIEVPILVDVSPRHQYSTSFL